MSTFHVKHFLQTSRNPWLPFHAKAKKLMKVLSARVWYNSCELHCRTIYLNHFPGKPDFSVFKSLLLGWSDSAEGFLQSPACRGQVLPAFEERGGGGTQLQCACARGIPLLLVPCPCLLSAQHPPNHASSILLSPNLRSTVQSGRNVLDIY